MATRESQTQERPSSQSLRAELAAPGLTRASARPFRGPLSRFTDPRSWLAHGASISELASHVPIRSAGLQPTQTRVAGTMDTCRGFGVASSLFRSWPRRAPVVRRTPPRRLGPANSIRQVSPVAASRTPSCASAAPAILRTAAKPSVPRPRATFQPTARTVTRFRRNAASRFNPARRAATRTCGARASSKAAKVLGP